MSYIISTDAFKTTFPIPPNGGNLRHNHSKHFKLFPFITSQQSTSPAVESLRPLIGHYLSLIEGIKPKPISMDVLMKQLEDETEIESGNEELFRDAVSHLFFENGQLRSLNLKMREYMPCVEPAEKRIAEYLVDVLGDRDCLRLQVQKALDTLAARSNVLEGLIISKLDAEKAKAAEDMHYHRVTTALKVVFEQDFEYILASEVRTRDHLVALLEFYYFTYTAQACLQLDRLYNGDSELIRPLYFCLEWEKTSQNRLCFMEGWKRLKSALDKMFAHAITLEILNQTEGDERFDYVKLARMADLSAGEDEQIAGQIRQLSTMYRGGIVDCQAMRDLPLEVLPRGKTASEIRFLFESVRIQFETTVRRKPYSSYAEKFEKFCEQNYLKLRGRSGFMLNISEETLIFLTKICVKDQETLRLKEVFCEFERRGVFLDSISKEQVAQYFEKLNLIEKKSDSGDAKYVKRIL